jgi:hypothetical protein
MSNQLASWLPGTDEVLSTIALILFASCAVCCTGKGDLGVGARGETSATC